MRVANLSKVISLPATKPPEELVAGSTLYLQKKADGSLNAGLLNSTGNRMSVLVREHRLSGPKTLYQSVAGATVQGTYIIENFDSFTTYAVTVSAGSVSRVGNTITFTSPTVPGSVYLAINGEYSKIKVKAPAVLPPSITYPLAGMQFVSAVSATCSAMQTSGPADTNIQTKWRLATNFEFTQDVLNYQTAAGVNTLNLGSLVAGTVYYLSACQVGATMGDSAWSEPVQFETRLATLAAIGSGVLYPSPYTINQGFGECVALADDGTLAVVASKYGAGAGKNVGMMQTFRNTAGSWVVEDTITNNTFVSTDKVGTAMAVSEDGDSIALGAPGNVFGGNAVGAVFLMQQVNEVWSLETTLRATGGAAGDLFGTSVVMHSSGKTLLIGAPGSLTGSGAVYVFSKLSGSWVQEAKLVAPDAAVNDSFGQSVSLNADMTVALVGAPNNKPLASKTGAAYLFRKVSSTWQYVTKLYPVLQTANALFGSAVAISADGAESYIGAPGQVVDALVNGSVTLFITDDGSHWTEKESYRPVTAEAGQGFGGALVINADSTRMLIGAKNKLNRGAFYLFDRMNAVWSLTAQRDAVVPRTGALFGTAVALTADGRVGLVGAPADTGVIAGGGAAYIFS